MEGSKQCKLTKSEMMFLKTWPDELTRKTTGCDFRDKSGRLIEVKCNTLEVSQIVEMRSEAGMKPLLVVVTDDDLLVFELLRVVPHSIASVELNDLICVEQDRIDAERARLVAEEESLNWRERTLSEGERHINQLMEQVCTLESHLANLNEAQTAVARFEMERVFGTLDASRTARREIRDAWDGREMVRKEEARARDVQDMSKAKVVE